MTRKRELRRLLRNIVVAADRMRDDWAEAEDDPLRRQELWCALHNAADDASDEVYPL